jgi:hypothetical protein
MTKSQFEQATMMTSPSDIAVRAYELFLQRGAEPGRDLEDWLEAERQLNAQSSFAHDEDGPHRELPRRSERASQA